MRTPIVLLFAAACALAAQPMPVDETRSANQRWLNKPIQQSRPLDDMEDPATWSHHGPGNMALATESPHNGRNVLRLSCPTKGDKPTKSGRPWGEAVLRRKFDGEDWSAMNRLSIWVRPTMPGHKTGSVVIKLINDAAARQPMPTHGPMHYALVKPGEWNHIVWEVAHLSRDKVSAVELIYRQQGNEAGAAETVTIDFDQLELQKVEPDHFEGWNVWPGRIAYSHSGYEASAKKSAIASSLKAAEFSVRDESGNAVLIKKVRAEKTPLGEFQVLEFSEITQPGRYTLSAGETTTPPFPIAKNIWRETVLKTINFFHAERCGDAIPGVHDVCHADWQAERNGKTIIINGGWHDAGDLSQGIINTGEAVHAMLTLAERVQPTDGELAAKLIEEAKWGLAWLHRTRFGDGFRVTWATMDYWTDGKVGTVDDTFGDVADSPTENAVGAAASAIAARVLKPIDTELAANSLRIAREDWQFAIDRLKDPNVECTSAVALASIELYRTTGEQKYADKAVEMAGRLVDSQQRTYTNWSTPLSGFFHSHPSKRRPLTFFHRGHDQAPAVALAELCRILPAHADWMQWYSAVAMHSEYQQTVAAFQAPWHTLPAGIWRLSDRPDQVGKGMKLADDWYLRRFPVWDGLRGHFGILLSQTKALASASRLRNRPELAELCHEQLQWVVGRNPFAQSTMYGEGHDYAPQYTAMSGNMTGSLPVGIQTKLNEDVPYWPVTNCWNYKEVWVHPSSRWLYAMADLMADGEPPAVELGAQAGEDGTVTITAKLTDASQPLSLRVHNIEIQRSYRPSQPPEETRQAIHWVGRIIDRNAPAIAAVLVNDDVAQVRDIVIGK